MTQVVVEALYIASAEVKMYYVIALILQDFFFIIGVCITFHVFWNLIHTFLNRLTHPGKSYSALPILHWIFFSIALVLGLAKFALFTVMQIDYVNSRYRGIELSYYQLRGAMFIIYWVLSMEIMALVAFVLSKAGHRFISKVRCNIHHYPLKQDMK